MSSISNLKDDIDRWFPWLLALSLVPLLFAILIPGDEDTGTRLKRTLEKHPEIISKLEKNHSNGQTPTLDSLLQELPEQKIEGAFLSRFTVIHWVLAVIAALGFYGFVRLAYPTGLATWRQFWIAGLFTGSVGIILLLVAQQLANFSANWIYPGIGILTVPFYILKFIGYSYQAALDPNNDFLSSFFGFTFGVGFCEELCKSLPLLWYFRRYEKALDLRGAVLWGLATGFGFGISEGIHYSAHYYNGLSGGEIYWVRFFSCVSLHAVWSASTAVLICSLQARILEVSEWKEWFAPIMQLLGASIVLHGFYDTFLKREMHIAALITAAVSFVLFFWLYEWGVKQEQKLEATSDFGHARTL